MNTGLRDTESSNPFAPTGIIIALNIDGDGSISIQWLLACPCERFDHSGTQFQCSGKMHSARIPLRQQKCSEADTSTVGMTRIERSTQLQQAIRAFQL